MTAKHVRNFQWLLTALVICAALAGATRVQAQDVYAAIHGIVTDSSGAVIPNARVTARDTSTGISSTKHTDSSGYYIFTHTCRRSLYCDRLNVGFSDVRLLRSGSEC
jgi:hypothetical protein